MTLNEYNKSILDKIIDNVLSCRQIIENMVMEQNQELDGIGINNTRDFIFGSIWSIILEKFIVTLYLQTGKTLSYDVGSELSKYVLDKLSRNDVLNHL